jgi:hypothetical protein
MGISHDLCGKSLLYIVRGGEGEGGQDLLNYSDKPWCKIFLMLPPWFGSLANDLGKPEIRKQKIR